MNILEGKLKANQSPSSGYVMGLDSQSNNLDFNKRSGPVEINYNTPNDFILAGGNEPIIDAI
eukprot:12339681-Ditylum_brightwellii.AAC.1